jgi:hypothetical protein
MAQSKHFLTAPGNRAILKRLPNSASQQWVLDEAKKRAV